MIVDEAYCEFNLLEDPDASLDLLGCAPEPRAAAHLLEGLRPVRAARRLRALRLRRAAARAGPGAPAVLLQRARPGGGRRGAGPPGRGARPRDADGRRAHRDGRAAARAGPRARRVAGQLLLGAAGRRARRGRRSSPACSSAACWCAPGSGARQRGAGAAGHLRAPPRRTSASSPRSASCSSARPAVRRARGRHRCRRRSCRARPCRRSPRSHEPHGLRRPSRCSSCARLRG